MPILNRAAEMQQEIAGWRRELHAIPELGFDLFKTSAFVADKLRSFGCDEVVTGIAGTGIVAIIRGNRGPGPTIGARADMDALPITEESGAAHASTHSGAMHACGHDGHTAMLLGAAKYLSETRNFAGALAVVFQPAEEGGGGGKVMVEEGLMERFGIAKVFGMHNMPGLAVGQFAICQGPIMAATAEFYITVRGKGGHAAMPHRAVDPIVAASQIVLAFQTIVSRSVDPIESLVVSVTKFHAGDACNVIPPQALITGTVRSLKDEVAAIARRRIHEICDGIAASTGTQVSVDYDANYPVTFNHADETVFAADIAAGIAGEDKVERAVAPTMCGEDFSYMLKARPGAFILLGNGPSTALHSPAYDFNDEAIPHGVSYWVKVVETALSP